MPAPICGAEAGEVLAVEEAVVIAVVGIIIIEGIWLAALTWMMWRRTRQKKKAPAPEEPTKST